MNNILLKIFPEPVSHLIMRFNIHPLAELFIKEKQNKMLKEPRRLLKLYKTKLRQLKNYDENLEVCRLVLYSPSISDYDKQEAILEYTELFNGYIDHYEGLIKRGLAIRQFYYDVSDDEDEYTDFIHNFI
jgi:hypothetical protein